MLFNLLTMLLLSFMLSACGIKGKLFIPKEEVINE